jgi:hypothetical protein
VAALTLADSTAAAARPQQKRRKARMHFISPSPLLQSYLGSLAYVDVVRDVRAAGVGETQNHAY